MINRILQLTSPNSFASLIILNRKWRTVSQQAHLYAHHLSRCPSYAAAHGGVQVQADEYSLGQLRRLFAREVKRNLFEAYLRPKETIISLESTSISSSSAPGGEAFHFSLSPRGHYVLAYSSSRIHVLDVTSVEVEVKREFKILRRPAAATITDDGFLLAVLSTDLQVDLYDLRTVPPKHTRAVALDHTPRTIALSPTGSVLACAYDSGVEVSSLDASSINTDRRAVKCYSVDSLSFSQDGTQLLGTTMQSRNPSTVVLTAPYYDPGGSLPEDIVSSLWTTSILFPNGSRDCSHAVLLPNPSDGESSWTFTYDRVFETFRAVRIDDLRNGTTYFTGPIADSTSTSKLLPSTLPAASESGDLVASGFQSAIWLYGVPEDLDALPIVKDTQSSGSDSEVSTPSNHLARGNSVSSSRSVNRPLNRTPQWQLLCDKSRNTFVEGRKIASLDQVTALSWVDECSTLWQSERLVAVAPGVGVQTANEDDGMAPVDGGRISILDFSYSVDDGTKNFVTVEVGNKEPEVLEEEHRDLDTEVAIVRRRTVAQRRGNRSHVSRSATTVARIPPPEMPPMPATQDIGDPFTGSARPARRSSQQTILSEQSENASVDEEQDAFDAPYSHTSPRSGTTLRRAATAAAVNRRLHPRAVAQEHIEYRRADGREEHPHESDADNWVPPPPPYTRDPVPPLPEHIQRSLLAEAALATLQRSNTHRAPNLDFPGLDTNTLHRSHTIATVASSSTGGSRRERISFNRSVSDTQTWTADRVSFEDDGPRPFTSASSPGFDDLYDVSPPGTPQPTPAEPTQITPMRPVPVNQIPRRPVGAPAGPSSSPAAPRRASGMHATLQQPVSQISEPMNQLLTGQLENGIGADGMTGTNQVRTVIMGLSQASAWQGEPSNPAIDFTGPTTPLNTLFKEVPQRPDETHHLTELPPTTPILPAKPQGIESQPFPLSRRAETAPVAVSSQRYMHDDPQPLWQRSDTAPAAPKPNPTVMVTSSGVVMPSPDQLARLNSRAKGDRPAGLMDPSRRQSIGQKSPQRVPSRGNSRSPSNGPIQGTPPRLTPEQAFMNRSNRPRAAIGAYGSSSHQGYPPPLNQYSTPPSRRLSGNSHSRSPSAGSPGLRPPMQRLETIHSQTSASGEQSAYAIQKAVMVSRQPSRAERSAAKNVRDAKKRGWRGNMKSGKKDKYGDGESSAGWTDVSRDTDMPSGKKEKTGGKCLVM